MVHYVELPDGRCYPVVIDSLETLPVWLERVAVPRGRCFLVTDEHVAHLHLESLQAILKTAGWTPYVLVLPPGEPTKALPYLERIYDEALRWGIDRRTPLLAFGGGVIGDLAGFAAATLLRGLPLVQLPTTLIAQVDSAIGGKTGINHALGKNLIGAFYQPALVLADPSLLQTLPEREWTSGLAEVVKHALIGDPALFSLLEMRWTDVLQRNPSLLPDLIARAVLVKIRIVVQDEREAGPRAILNFGHTFGHAIERVAGYGHFTHGEAVALGMLAALWLSHQRHPDLPLTRIRALLQRLPVPPLPETLDFKTLRQVMQVDKKTLAGQLRFVLLRRLGEAYLADDVPEEALQAAWQFACASRQTAVAY
ncbi:3-dehydroquinate synthase [Rhodothermus profundi]|uniref:3-dehydroquinate synthase n=1 Tax=Rhodothermus profundi TaxID=633813 RepID=A0A1M6P8J0_9BACT|nr:3-dehydroquinate synthase [Rhodothermus profundi]SHK04232.1 3-dehydroquinate synthase [Rhodothermus profundi]